MKIDLVALERQRLHGLVNADIPLIESLHADDFQLITPSGKVLDRAEYLGAVASRQLKYLFWEPIGEIEVRFYGEAACLRYRSVLDIASHPSETAPAADRDSYWHTDLYEHRATGWQVVWSQATHIKESRPMAQQ